MRAFRFGLVGALAIAGCGGGGGAKNSDNPGGKPDTAAKAAAQQYVDAYTQKNAKAICRSLAPKVQKQLADNKGTCVKTIKFSMKGQKYPKLVVAQAYATGTTAAATIQGSNRQVRLQRIGKAWKVFDGGS